MVTAYSVVKQDWLFGYCYLTCGIKFSVPESIFLKMRETVLEAQFLRNTERRFGNVRSESILVLFGILKDHLTKWDIGKCFWFGINFDIDQ